MARRNTLTNVVRQFESLSTKGTRLAIQAGFPEAFDDLRYTDRGDIAGLENHFQGIARYGNNLFITGSCPPMRHGQDWSRADLLVFELGSRSASGPWKSNLNAKGASPSADCLLNYFAVDRQAGNGGTENWWHAGSFGRLGDQLVIPLENSKDRRSVVRFVDVSNPQAPSVGLQKDIERLGSPYAYKGGVCTATDLSDDNQTPQLLTVWSDSDAKGARFHLDLYRSPSPGADFVLVGQFWPEAGAHDDDDVKNFHRPFQGLDFLWDTGGADGDKLFVVGFENLGEHRPAADPFDPNVNRACLYEVRLPAVWSRPGPLLAGPPQEMPLDFIQWQASILFDNDGDWYDMDAAACAYVDNGRLIAYSAYFYLDNDKPALRFSEFISADSHAGTERSEARTRLSGTLPSKEPPKAKSSRKPSRKGSRGR